MTDGLRCENCGQALLATDEACWQCGWVVKGKGAGGTAVAPSAAATNRPATEMVDTAVAVYAILTLLTILLLLVVFAALSRYPLA